jgi:hypothetical protein
MTILRTSNGSPSSLLQLSARRSFPPGIGRGRRRRLGAPVFVRSAKHNDKPIWLTRPASARPGIVEQELQADAGVVHQNVEGPMSNGRDQVTSIFVRHNRSGHLPRSRTSDRTDEHLGLSCRFVGARESNPAPTPLRAQLQ